MNTLVPFCSFYQRYFTEWKILELRLEIVVEAAAAQSKVI